MSVDSNDALIADAREYLLEAMRVTGTPGVSIALARHGEVIWEEAFGLADIGSKVPMTVDSLTRGGSMSKLYTATVVMQLVEEGVLDLYAPVSRYLPDCGFGNPLGERPVTLYDLLTFRSGLATDAVDGHLRMPLALADHVEHALREDRQPEYHGRRSRWTRKVGAEYQYSNFSVSILALVVERMNPERVSFDGLVRRRLIEPLGQRSTWLCHESAIPDGARARLCAGYAKFGNALVPSPYLYCQSYPASGLMTTAGDHVRLLLAYMAGGTFAGRQLLQPSTVQQILRPQSAIAGLAADAVAVGLMFGLSLAGKADDFFGRAGAYPWGWWSDSRAYPHQDFAIVAFTNRWDMMRWNHPGQEIVPGLVADFVSGWLRRATRCPGRTWAWKAAYVMGFMLAERCNGLLGIDVPLTADAMVSMIPAAAGPGRALGAVWDVDGFRAGAAAMSEVAGDAPSIERFVRSAEFPVAQHELPLLALEFGRRGSVPLPMRFWAESSVVRDAFDPGRAR